MSIVWSVKTFRPYLYGRSFTILSDHKPLQWLFSINDPGSRLLQWRLKLEEYQYTIKHIPGTQNLVADALSRINILTTPNETGPMKYIDSKEANLVIKLTTSEQHPELKPDEFQRKGKTIIYAYRNQLFEPFKLFPIKNALGSIKQLISKENPSLISIIDLTDSGQSTEYSRNHTERILCTCFAPHQIAWIKGNEPKNKFQWLKEILILFPSIQG